VGGSLENKSCFEGNIRGEVRSLGRPTKMGFSLSFWVWWPTTFLGSFSDSGMGNK
jgi:hypothetical protein